MVIIFYSRGIPQGHSRFPKIDSSAETNMDGRLN